MKYFLGIDNGGSFVKAGIVTQEGELIAVASEAVRNLMPQSGFTERNMTTLLHQNISVIKQVIIKSGVNPKDILCVSFSGHGKGLYLVGEDQQPAYNGILSTDNRAWKYPEKWKEEGTALKVYQKTYQKIMACQPVSLLAWFKDEQPEVLAATKYIFSVKDYIRFCLTGEAYGEYTDFSGGNLINLETGTYDKELMDLFGLGFLYEKLPPLKHSAELSGQITEAAARLTGLAAGTPVVAGMFDVDACGIAAGILDEQILCMIAGTWSINEYITTKPITNGTVELNSMFCIPGYFLIEESSPTSAGNMQWFIDILMSHEKQEAEAAGKSIYETTNVWVDSIHPEDSSLIFLPFLNGSNEDALAKGTFIGLSDYHEKRHMLRAVYEGIVFSHMTHLRRLLKNRTAPEAIRLVGGAARSKVWVQIFADAIQLPIETVTCEENGIMGSVIAAGIGMGIYASYQEAIAKMVIISDKVYPNLMKKEIYEKKYNTYCSVISALSRVWEDLE